MGQYFKPLWEKKKKKIGWSWNVTNALGMNAEIWVEESIMH